jgi:hypothetical protein
MLWLIGYVARAAGAEPREALIATILAAGTTSLFYYARHFFPYDLSLCFFLLSLARAVKPETRKQSSLIAGFWSCLGFLAYNGYWMVGGVVLVVHTLMALPDVQATATRAICAFAGLILPIAGLIGLGHVCGYDLLRSYLQFAEGINQGDFGVAWRFIPQYFWAAEHILNVVWSGALGMAAWWCLRRRNSRRTALWLAIAALLYAALVLPSDLVPRFTVAARHVRILAPFLCLLTAAVLARMPASPARFLSLRVAAIALGINAVLNFAVPLRQVFPPEFSKRALDCVREATKADWGPYRIVNAYFLHNPTWAARRPAEGVTVYRRTHPFQFIPYLYEGYSEAARRRYREQDLSMRVVRLSAGGEVFVGYPGALKLVVKWKEQPDTFIPEPLLTSGVPVQGDTLYVRYLENDRILFGHDHWGSKEISSTPFQLDRTKPHVLIASMGSFFPAEDTPFFQKHPDLRELKRRVFVSIDGAVVLNQPSHFYDAPSHSLTIMFNFIGASNLLADAEIEILSCERLSPSELTSLLQQPIAP